MKKKEDRQDSIYTSLGSSAHQCLEDFYTKKITFEEMYEQYNDAWITCYELAQLKFDRCDAEKNLSIAEKYKSNMQYFFKNHTVYPYNVLIEKPITINADGNIFIGYIDALFQSNDGDITIIDFKSSSAYKGKTLEEHSQQLQLYALGIHQATGLELSRIHGCFNFLKYATIEYIQANGKTKTRDVERNKIGEALQSNLKVWIKKLGYEDQMDKFLMMVLDDNGLERLPQDLQDKYKIHDCHTYVDTSEEAINKLVKDISITIQDIELREEDYKTTKSEKCFWDDQKSVESNSYYMANLMSDSPNLHKPYAEYLAKLEASKNGDIFGNLGMPTTTSTNKVIENKNEVDLSWLDSIM